MFKAYLYFFLNVVQATEIAFTVRRETTGWHKESDFTNRYILHAN